MPQDSEPTADISDKQPTVLGGSLSSLAGTTVGGRYKILGQLGEGGFGLVYQAEQIEPVRRRVAVKVIKPGMDSKSVLARFEAERQALAVMDHPNIARVLDGGVTDRGLPYFVMDLVRGESITDFCDLHKLTIRERVELFRSVCTAVQHAHTKGVIHRDIKPSNILVEYSNGVPTPKIIDFGIAKAIDQRLSEHTIFTERGQLVGTPEYMSPEQAEMSGLDIDTRTDVYSLGAVLYELLTGFAPFDSASLRSAAFNEIQRIIRDVEPPRPSTRISTHGGTGVSEEQVARAASARSLRNAELSDSLRRELDWIVLKCLDKNRDRRYATPLSLEEDLGHFLGNEPVAAKPPSPVYKLQKFARRNRVGLATASGFAIVGLSSIVIISVLLSRSVAAEREASRRLSEARAQAELVVDEVGRSWYRGSARGSVETASVVWRWASTVLDENDPLALQAAESYVLALGSDGDLDRMLEVAEEAVDRSQHVNDPRARVWALEHLHWARLRAALDSKEAVSKTRQRELAVETGYRVLRESESRLGTDVWESVLFASHLAATLHLLDRGEESVAIVEQWHTRVDEVDMPVRFHCRAHSIVGMVLAANGRFDDAEPHLQAALSRIPDELALSHRDAQRALRRVADAYALWGESEDDMAKQNMAEELRTQIVYWDSW